MINVIGDAAHNFIDGVLIGASYLVSPSLGLSTVLVPMTAGGFVYIAAADLIPELQHDRTLRGGDEPSAGPSLC